MAAVSTNYGTAGDSTLESSSRDASGQKSGGSNAKSVSMPGSGNREARRGVCIGNEAVAFGVLGGSAGRGRRVQSPDTDGIELADQAQRKEAGDKMYIRKDVQYAVEYDGAGSTAGLHKEGSGDQHSRRQRS